MNSPSAAENVSLDMPHYGIGPLGAWKRLFAKYATFEGRASRSEFAWVVAVQAVLAAATYVPLKAWTDNLLAWMSAPEPLSGSGTISATDLYSVFELPPVLGVYLVFWLVTLVPTLAVAVRRLHDAGVTGWFVLVVIAVGLLPFMAWVGALALALVHSSEKGQRYDSGSGYNSLSRSSSGQESPANLTDA